MVSAVSARTAVLSAAELRERAVYRRAIDAAIWGMPIVSVAAMRRAFFSAGASYGDVVYLSRPADWRLQIPTPNASSVYVFLTFSLKDGPVVIDCPAAVGAGLSGSILDAWQVPIADVGPEGEDQGKGGKYLLLPPDFQGVVPAGYLVLRPATCNGYAAFRAIPGTRMPEDTAKAIALVKQLRVYPLSQADAPPPQRHIDVAGQLFDGLVRMDDTFFDSLAVMLNEEPVQPRDAVAMGMLRSIGIEKGRPFTPDAGTRAILKDAAAVAKAQMTSATTNVTPYWTRARWGSPGFAVTGEQTGFTYQSGTVFNLDDRGAMFFFACALPKKLGADTLYLIAARDASNSLFDGGKSYRLHVPAKVPAKQFWAVTVYDLNTAAFIRGALSIEINSSQRIQKNPDGSVDVYFSPKSPAGKQSNWIYTEPGQHWVAAFRVYGPEPAIHDKSWAMGNIESTK